jgi:hypothetical protein
LGLWLVILPPETAIKGVFRLKKRSTWDIALLYCLTKIILAVIDKL